MGIKTAKQNTVLNEGINAHKESETTISVCNIRPDICESSGDFVKGVRLVRFRQMVCQRAMCTKISCCHPFRELIGLDSKHRPLSVQDQAFASMIGFSSTFATAATGASSALTIGLDSEGLSVAVSVAFVPDVSPSLTTLSSVAFSFGKEAPAASVLLSLSFFGAARLHPDQSQHCCRKALN